MHGHSNYFEATERNRRTLVLLEALVEQLATQRGRKSLVLVSEGFADDPQLPHWRAVLEACRRENVAIYFINARGLVGPDFSAEFSAPAPDPEDFDVERHLARHLSLPVAGAQSIAWDTGGLALQNANDLAPALGRIADESRTYYLLGYRSTNAAPDGRFRRISVRVRRPGLEVRARKGYYAAPKPTAPVPSIPPRGLAPSVVSTYVADYLDLVRRYRGGDYGATVEALAAWPERAVAAVIGNLARAQRFAAADRPCREDCFRAAALLHTEAMALRRDHDRNEEAGRHQRRANDLIEAVPERPGPGAFHRLWALFVASDLTRHLRFGDALKVLQGCRKRHGADAEVLLAEGVVHEARAWVMEFRTGSAPGRFDSRPSGREIRQAEESYREALRADPAFEEAHLRLGRVQQLQGWHDDAEREFAWVVAHARNPEMRALAHLFRGELLETRGRLAEAIAAYRAAADEGPSQSVRLALSHALLRSGDRAAAARSARPALEATVRSPDVWLEYRQGSPHRLASLLSVLRSRIAE